MDVFHGTSGFSYAAWKGRFYPSDLPASAMLAFYSRHFTAVEINSTYYRMPVAKTLTQWRDAVEPGFRFALKCPQRVTHVRKLIDCAADRRRFVRIAATLGDQLGPILVQLPPTLRRDAPLLDAFLAPLAGQVRVTVEFRHASWFDDTVYAVLARRGAALCIAESDDLRTPFVATAAWGYLRLRRTRYDARSLRRLRDQVRVQRWDAVHVFFKHEDTATGPRYAQRWAELWAKPPVR